MFQRLKRGGWPYSQPPNVPFDINRASPQAKGKVAWWPTLGSRGGNVLRDLSGRGHDGSFNGDLSWVTDPVLGHVVDYPGTDDYVSIANHSDFSVATTGQLSISLWLRTDVIGVTQDVISKAAGVGFREWVLRLAGATNRYNVFVRNNAGGLYLSVDTGASVAGALTHIVITIDAAAPNLSLYQDGVFKASDVASAGVIAGNLAVPVTIGAYGTLANDFNGTVGDVRVYNRVLTPAEVWAAYVRYTRWELYRPRIGRLRAMVPGAPAVGQPMMLRGTTVPGLRQWHPRV